MGRGDSSQQHPETASRSQKEIRAAEEAVMKRWNLKPGDRIELLETSEEHEDLQPGMQGTVRTVTPNQVRVLWDGRDPLKERHLMIIPGGDQIIVIERA